MQSASWLLQPSTESFVLAWLVLAAVTMVFAVLAVTKASWREVEAGEPFSPS